jgi:hypothetical protein
METPAEIAHGVAETKSGDQSVQGDDVATGNSARHASEVAIDKRDPH